MTKVLFSILVTLWGVSFSHAEPLYALEGVTANNRGSCALLVLSVGYDGGVETPDRFYAEVSTTDSHGGQGHAPLRIRTVAGKPGTLFGKSADGHDQIAVTLDPPQPLDLKNAKSFNLRWLHGSHHHTLQCTRLKPRAF